MTIVYDRTKTAVRRHVAPGKAVPLHPEAVGFAGHYDFDVLAAYRPTGKGRVEGQVLIVRDHVLSGRSFPSVEEMDAAFITWVPQRRAPAHRTHQQIIGERAVCDHVALRSLPPTRIWWLNGTYGRSARTAWPPSAATSTRCPPAGSDRVSWWDPGHKVAHAAFHRRRQQRRDVAGGPSSGDRPRGPRGRRGPLGRPAYRQRTSHHNRRRPAPASPRASSGREGRTSACPAEPCCGHPPRDRLPAAVGL